MPPLQSVRLPNERTLLLASHADCEAVALETEPRYDAGLLVEVIQLYVWVRPVKHFRGIAVA